MFLIPTYLAKSPIEGLGVFTPSFIAKGTVIWELTPAIDLKFTDADIAQFPQPYQKQVRKYLYQDIEGMYVLCGDNAKFLNHSDSANCDDSAPLFAIANRDIAANEELTCNYKDFDPNSWAKLF